MDFSNIIYDVDEVRIATAAGAVSNQSQGQADQGHGRGSDNNDDSGGGGGSPSSPNQSVYSTDSLESFNSLSLFDDLNSSISTSSSPRSDGPSPSSGDEDSGARSGSSGRNTSLDSGLSGTSYSNENEVNNQTSAGVNGGGSGSGADNACVDAGADNEDNYHYDNNVGLGYSDYEYEYQQQQQQQQQMQTHVILFMPQDQGAPTSNEYPPTLNMNEPMVSNFIMTNGGQDNGLFPLPPGPPPALPLFPNQIINNATLVSTNDHNAYGGGYSSNYYQTLGLNNAARGFSGAENGAGNGNVFFDCNGAFIGTPEQLYQFCDPNNISISSPAGLFNSGYPCLVNEDIHIMGEEFPSGTYVSSVYDPSCLNVNSIKYNQCNYQYFVPPMVEDGDYFGGQQPIWQNRIIHSFEKFSPDVWIMKGVEEIKNLYRTYWHVFTITAKLRFCCRSCKRPWTSMRGRIIFCFNLDQLAHRGYVFMKIFGQKCVQLTCTDTSDFQVPACYPEEIHRVMWKVSEYIGFIFYNIPLSAQFFLEPDKAYRGGNPSTPHRKSVCQACASGFCSAAKAKNFLPIQS